MNREETKKAIAVMQAFVDGEKISNKAGETSDPFWNWGNTCYYVKKEPKTVPFETIEEIADAMNKHGCVLKGRDGIATIITVYKNNLSESINIEFSSKELGGFTPEYMLNEYTFLDGTLFGKVVEE